MSEVAVVETIGSSTTEEPETETGFEFDEGFQRKIVALILRDNSFAAKVHNLIEPEFFEREVDGYVSKIALDYYAKYRKTPDISILASLIKDAVIAKKIRKDLLGDIKDRIKEVLRTDISDREYVVDKVVEFARNKAIARAILASVEDHAKGNYAKIKRRMEEALLVGSDDDNEYDYFDMIESRTEERKLRIAGVGKKDGITTGVLELDKELYHGGWARKELSAIMGPAKAGKSMSLGEFAKNAALAGYDTSYLSCEVAAKIIADRTDANISDVLMKKLDDNAHAVEEAVKKIGSKSGAMKFYEYASGTLKPSQIRRLLERQRARGLMTDLLVVDYADIMCPEFRADSQIDNMRSIYIDLRAIAFDYNVAVLTATQTNREGAKKMVATATDVAEDFNKVRTVDLLLSINASEAEKAAGEARIYFAAARNSEAEFSIRIKQDRSKMRFITKVLGRE
jgi:replicative DNA helicase